MAPLPDTKSYDKDQLARRGLVADPLRPCPPHDACRGQQEMLQLPTCGVGPGHPSFPEPFL